MTNEEFYLKNDRKKLDGCQKVNFGQNVGLQNTL